MTLTIPETIPFSASQREQHLFHVLKAKLSEGFSIRHEPPLQCNLYPDFTILSPTFGLMIIADDSSQEGTARNLVLVPSW